MHDNEQPTLPYFQRTSKTSRTASVSMYETAPSLRARVWRHLCACREYGATTEEIIRALDMKGSTVRPRIVELREQGFVATTDRVRKTKAGRNAAVHVAIKPEEVSPDE